MNIEDIVTELMEHSQAKKELDNVNDILKRSHYESLRFVYAGEMSIDGMGDYLKRKKEELKLEDEHYTDFFNKHSQVYTEYRRVFNSLKSFISDNIIYLLTGKQEINFEEYGISKTGIELSQKR